MIIVFHQTADAGAHAFCQNMAQTSAMPVVAVSLSDLVHHHGLQIYIHEKTGYPEADYFLLTTGSGTIIDSRDIQMVINGIDLISQENFRHFLPEDQNYVLEEWHSIFLTMLAITSHKNPLHHPAPFAFCGQKHSQEQLLVWAQQAGLLTLPFAVDDDGRLYGAPGPAGIPCDFLVMEQQFVSPQKLLSTLSASLKQQMLDFKALVGEPSLIIRLRWQQAAYQFETASAVNSFDHFSPAVIDWLADRCRATLMAW